ncbi:hypothetical protein D3C81_1927500 [compost metagenome]
MLLKITWRADDHPARVEDRPGYQTGVRQSAGTDCQIHAFLDQIDKAVFQPHFHLQAWMLRTELRHAFAEQQFARNGRHRHTDGAGQLFTFFTDGV